MLKGGVWLTIILSCNMRFFIIIDEEVRYMCNNAAKRLSTARRSRTFKAAIRLKPFSNIKTNKPKKKKKANLNT